MLIRATVKKNKWVILFFFQAARLSTRHAARHDGSWLPILGTP